MKSSSLAFVVLSIFIMCSCAKEQNDLKWQEVSGKVKSIRTTGYNAKEKFGEISEGDVLYDESINNLIEFNKDGNITEISYFDQEGDLAKKSIFVFNDEGKVSKVNTYDGDGDEIGRTIYTYNEDNNVTMIVYYDKDGNIDYTQQMEWDGDKCIKQQFLNEYSDGGYNMNEYKGDHLVKSVIYDKTGKKTGEYTEYENDKMTKIVKPEFTVSLTYNDKGLCTSIENGIIYNTNSYMFSEGDSFIYEYEYDDKGNWIRKVEKVKNSMKAKRIFVREIEYY